MKLPKSFTYKGHVWKIVQTKNLVHEDGTKCDGICDTDLRTIYLEKTLVSAKKQFAFFHELQHVVVHESHIPLDAPFTESIEDILAEAFAELLTTVFKVSWRK